MRNRIALAIAISLGSGLALTGTEVLAQQQGPGSQQPGASSQGEDIVTSESMEQQDLYENGISLDNLLGGDVVDRSGNTVGSVEDFVVGADSSRVVGLIVETGGFLDIGDHHVLIPFDEANIRGENEVQVDVSGSTAEELSMFREIEGQSLRNSKSRASEILGGLAYSDGEPYGHVEDLIFNSDGDILATVVQTDVMYDSDYLYAWPYYRPNQGPYDVPADERYFFGEEPIDRDQLQGAEADSQ